MQHATLEGPGPLPVLTCSAHEDMLGRLAAVLQSGFTTDVPSGTPVFEMLQTLPGFSADYIEQRIQTIFINGDAIDDLYRPVTDDTVTIALSAAMPGLAGAILRRNSPHAALRKNASPGSSATKGAIVPVVIKLFNAVAIERGPALLQKGVILNSGDLSSFLALRPSLLHNLSAIEIDGLPVSPDNITATLRSYATITLRVAL